MAPKEELQKELTEKLDRIRLLRSENKWDENLWEETVNLAHEIHKLVQPKHHGYMLKNREVSPDQREFYNHIHPIEDLLAFMQDPHANDDPEDTTINHEFEMKIYTRRWGHYDTYNVKRIATGWEIGNLGISGVCDKSGMPYLFQNFRQDFINYPEAIPEYLEWLWEKAAESGLTHGDVQNSLNTLSNWISECEKQSPKGIWEGYK